MNDLSTRFIDLNTRYFSEITEKNNIMLMILLLSTTGFLKNTSAQIRLNLSLDRLKKNSEHLFKQICNNSHHCTSMHSGTTSIK